MKTIAPMLSRTLNYSDLDWIEDDRYLVVAEKYDGFRELMYIDEQGVVTLVARSGADHSAAVPHLTGTLIPTLADTIIDGEGVGPGGRIESTKSVFGSGVDHALAYQAAHGQATYVAFDILRYRGLDLVDYPFETRMKFLHVAMPWLPERVIAETVELANKKAFYDQVTARGGEGIMVKHLKMTYSPGKRTSAWSKIKKIASYDVVIMGFTAGKGKYADVIGAIRYGYYKAGKLVEIGRSSGMTDLEREVFAKNPEAFIGRVVELVGHEASKTGVIRFPRFAGMRDDKKPEECIWEA